MSITSMWNFEHYPWMNLQKGCVKEELTNNKFFENSRSTMKFRSALWDQWICEIRD